MPDLLDFLTIGLILVGSGSLVYYVVKKAKK